MPTDEFNEVVPDRKAADVELETAIAERRAAGPLPPIVKERHPYCDRAQILTGLWLVEQEWRGRQLLLWRRGTTNRII